MLPCLPTMRTPEAGGVASILQWGRLPSLSMLPGTAAYFASQVFGAKNPTLMRTATYQALAIGDGILGGAAGGVLYVGPGTSKRLDDSFPAMGWDSTLQKLSIAGAVSSGDWALETGDGAGDTLAGFSDGQYAAHFSAVSSSLNVYFCNNLTDEAAIFTDGSRTVTLVHTANGDTASFSDGVRNVVLCNTVGGVAVNCSDAANQVYLCDGTYAIYVIMGYVTVPGTTGNTYRWDTNHTAPTPQTLLTLPLNVYGQGTITDLLGDPDNWALINIAGTDYVLPCYLP